MKQAPIDKNYRLPQRIRKRKYFLRAANNGRKFVSIGVVFQAVANNLPQTVRVGFTTTKKLGKANIRNKIRRRLREAVRLAFKAQALPGYDYVFIGRKATVDRPMELLKKDTLYVLHQFKKSLNTKQESPATESSPCPETQTGESNAS